MPQPWKRRELHANDLSVRIGTSTVRRLEQALTELSGRVSGDRHISGRQNLQFMRYLKLILQFLTLIIVIHGSNLAN